jgi:chromosome partitioning protein
MLSSGELRLASMMGRERLLTRHLAKIKPNYDVCIIDTSPTLGLLAINALVAADEALIPICPDYFSLKGIKLLEDTMTSVRQNLAARLSLLGVLVTRYRKRVITDSALDLISEYFGPKLFNVKIPENIAIEEAHNAHMPMRKYNANSKAAAAYRELAKEAF